MSSSSKLCTYNILIFPVSSLKKLFFEKLKLRIFLLCNSFSHSKPLFFSSSLMSAKAWRSHFKEPEFRRTEGAQTLGNLILEIPLWEKLPGASLPHYHL
jgi:hypothetical protein